MDAVLESPPTPEKRFPYFTKQNASEMQKRAIAAIHRRNEERSTANAKASELPDNYVAEQLARTRAQISKIQDRLDRLVNGDARDLKAVTDALYRLREIEQRLAMRPSPGNLRPSNRPAKSNAGPLAPEE